MQSDKGRGKDTFLQQCKPIIDSEMSDREVHLYFTESKEDTAIKAKKAVEEDGCDLVVSCGGDGTNHDVLNAIMDMQTRKSKVAMACLPLGTGNDFAKSIHFTEREEKWVNNFERMIKQIAKGATVTMDVGRLVSTNEKDKSAKIEKFFLNIASYGVSASVIDKVNTGRIWFNKDFTVSMHSVLQQFFYSNKIITTSIIEKDNKEETKTRLQQMTAVCNGQFFGSGLQVGVNASIQDGKFNICTLGDVGFFDILKIIPALYKGTHVEHSKVSTAQAVKVIAKPKIGTDRIVIEADGELSGILPAEFEIVEAGLDFVVHQDYLSHV